MQPIIAVAQRGFLKAWYSWNGILIFKQMFVVKIAKATLIYLPNVISE